MKNIICSFLLILIISSVSLYAQEEEVENSLFPGSWSLQFRVEKDFTIGNFLGSNFSGKYHFSEISALRVGVGFSGQSSNNSYDGYYGNPDNRGDFERNSHSILFSAQFVYYFNPKNEVNFFLGSGLRYGLSEYEQYSNEINKIDSGLITIDRSEIGEGWSAGVDLITGVEWFVNENISLLGEYQTSFYFTKSNGENRYKKNHPTEPEIFDESITESDVFSFGASLVKLGLSVYC